MSGKRRETLTKTSPILDSSFYTPHKIRLVGRISANHEDVDTGCQVLDTVIADKLRAFLPAIQKESKEWNLIYSTDQHGISVNTMFDRVRNWDMPPSLTPCVLAIKSHTGLIYGAFLSEAPTWRKGYYGNGHCFLWKESTETGLLAAYLSTGINEHYILSETGANLAFGGGDNGFALWIDEELLRASSNTSKTYGNEPLTSEKNFEIAALELWAISI